MCSARACRSRADRGRLVASWRRCRGRAATCQSAISQASGIVRRALRRRSGRPGPGGRGGAGGRGRVPRRAGGSSPPGYRPAGPCPGPPGSGRAAASRLPCWKTTAGPGLVLVAVLLGPDDAVVGDALQGQVLAAGGAPGRTSAPAWSPFARIGRSGCGGARRRAGRCCRRGSPPRSGRRRRHWAPSSYGPTLPFLRRRCKPSLCSSLGSCLEKVGVTRSLSLRGGWLRKSCQMPGSVGLLFEPVPAVDASALELVELADGGSRRGEEDGRLDARDVKLGGYLVGGLAAAAPELLRLAVGEVQRVLDRAGLVVVAEHPGGAVVRWPCQGGS